jgi:hypothetical protein
MCSFFRRLILVLLSVAPLSAFALNPGDPFATPEGATDALEQIYRTEKFDELEALRERFADNSETYPSGMWEGFHGTRS